jgi:ankyrin repeat protein
MYAATAGDRVSVDLLMAHGAGVNARAANGWTALTLASARGFDTVVSRLLANDADPNIADIYGWTPLMRAVEQNRPTVVRVLLDTERVDVNAHNDEGDTALHRAAVQGLSDIVGMFIERGADLHVRNRAGRTPGMLAMAQGHKATAEIIGRAVAN